MRYSISLFVAFFLFAIVRGQSYNDDITRALAKSFQLTRLTQLERIPAKQMSLVDAYETLAIYNSIGLISISPKPKYDSTGAPVIPSTIPRITLNKLDPQNNYVKFDYNGKAHAVSLWYNRDGVPPPSTGIIQIQHFNIDARNVVGLVRLALYLAREKNVTQIHHSGMRGSDRADCHGEGRAVDFDGVVFEDGSALFVGRDWAQKKILVAPDYTQQGTTDQWPFVSQKLHYRLDTDAADQNARIFFEDLYAFIQTQYQDRTADKNDPGGSLIGDKSYIMHPDHYQSNGNVKGRIGRETHREHIHMQIGPTGRE